MGRQFIHKTVIIIGIKKMTFDLKLVNSSQNVLF